MPLADDVHIHMPGTLLFNTSTRFPSGRHPALLRSSTIIEIAGFRCAAARCASAVASTGDSSNTRFDVFADDDACARATTTWFEPMETASRSEPASIAEMTSP